MLRVSRLAPVFLSIAAFACSSAPPEADVDSAGAEALSASLFHPVRVLDVAELVTTGEDIPEFRPTPVVDVSTTLHDQAAAEAAAPAFMARSQQAARVGCAADLGVATSALSTLFGGCRTLAVPTQGQPPDWQPAFQCDVGLCAAVPLDAAEVVRFDGRAGVLATDSGNAPRPDGTVVLIADLNGLATWASSPGGASRGITAQVAHLELVRDGHAVEVPLPVNRADGLFGFPAEGVAVAITVPHDATELAFFVRWERFHYVDHPTEDGSFDRILGARAADGYVSNFGKNFRLAVR